MKRVSFIIRAWLTHLLQRSACIKDWYWWLVIALKFKVLDWHDKFTNSDERVFRDVLSDLQQDDDLSLREISLKKRPISNAPSVVMLSDHRPIQFVTGNGTTNLIVNFHDQQLLQNAPFEIGEMGTYWGPPVQEYVPIFEKKRGTP